MLSSKNILVTGANGLIGTELCHQLTKNGYTVRTLSRSHADFKWDTDIDYIDTQALNGIHCIVHLAGETIAQRWNVGAKSRIASSRIQSTRLLMREIARHGRPLDFISASGINYYGFKSAHQLTESAPAGAGFLADLCQDWEQSATDTAASTLIQRTAFIRTGVVLTPKGGALPKMLMPFKAGFGGRLGSGEQMMSWITLTDIVRIYIKAIEDDNLSGPVNAVTPFPISNIEFTKTLGRLLHRPTLAPCPEFILRLILGEMARETILCDLKVVPQKLQEAGFQWKFPHLAQALQEML